jgi:hypothetical protein
MEVFVVVWFGLVWFGLAKGGMPWNDELMP